MYVGWRNSSVLLGLAACMDPSPPPFSMSHFVDIMDTVQQNPENAISLCSSIPHEEKQAQCLLFAMEQIKIPKGSQIPTALYLEMCLEMCLEIPSDKIEHSECFFLLAEKTGDIEYCAQSTIFELDCNSHILSRYLLQHNIRSFEEANAIATQYHVPLEESASTTVSSIPIHQIARTIVYRHLLSLEKPIPIDRCAEFPHPSDCQKAGRSLYIDRLRYAMHQKKFPCEMESDLSPEILGDLYHQNNESLKNTFRELQEEYCDPQTLPH